MGASSTSLLPGGGLQPDQEEEQHVQEETWLGLQSRDVSKRFCRIDLTVLCNLDKVNRCFEGGPKRPVMEVECTGPWCQVEKGEEAASA